MSDSLDIKLINGIKSGEVSAFEVLFNKYYSPLCLFAVKYLNDLDSSREIVQNLFVYIWEHREKINIRHTVKSYLITAVRFNSQRYKNGKAFTLPIDQINEPSDDLYDSLELEELYRQLMSAIEELPEQCQRIFQNESFRRYEIYRNSQPITFVC